ncbi:hypothetical protein DXG01_010979 [Tephrocybe rancida]|nr:hypothetical protein DXG01_010979 [Tephrocybe rancida]
MPSHPGLRHFKNGISGVSQWTGAEHKAMERVFLGIMAGSVPDARVMQADVFVELEARSPPHFNIPKLHSMQHYTALIKLFGSADGFNTESPERLHIDYAKNAYHASNKNNYTIQMMNWLSWQESVDRFMRYLEWVEHGEMQVLSSDTERRVQLASMTGDVENEMGVVVTFPSPSSSLTQAAPPLTYQVARTHPVGLRNVPASTIIKGHNASRFLEAIHSYISSHGSPVTPHVFDGFDLFKRLTFILPATPHASLKDLKNVVRASLPQLAHDCSTAEPAHLDFALVRTGERNNKTAGIALEGASHFSSVTSTLLISLYPPGLRIAHV